MSKSIPANLEHIRQSWDAWNEWVCPSVRTMAHVPYHCILKRGHEGKHYNGGANVGVEWSDEQADHESEGRELD